MTTTRRIIDVTADLVPGFEAEETSEAKAVAFDHLEGVYISDSGEAITAADRVVEALIEAGWRPTVDEPAAEHHEPPNADAPTDVEIQAAAEAMDGHSWMTDPDEGSLCACGEVLAPSLEYAGDAYRSHIARVALVAAREVARHE